MKTGAAIRKIRQPKTATDTKKRRSVCLGDFMDPAVFFVRYSLPAYRLPYLKQAERMSLRAFRDEDTSNGGSRGVQAFRCLMHQRETVFQRPESLCIPLLFEKRACIGACPILLTRFGFGVGRSLAVECARSALARHRTDVDFKHW